MPVLIVLGVALEICFIALARAPQTPFFSLPFWFSAAALFYLIGVVWVLRARPAGRRELRLIFLAAVVFRLTLLPLTPSLSHQLWRFQWDGRIQQAGFNPYQYAPQNSLFNPIRTAADQAVPAPALAAYHPPLAELLFRWDYGWFGGLRGMKVAFIVFDLLLMALLIRILRGRGLPPERVLIYAWSPLSVFEIAGNGHMEAAAGFLALLALYWAGRRTRLSGIAIAAAAATQWYAMALLPVVLAAARRRWAGALGWLAGLAVLVTLPYIWIEQHFGLGIILQAVHAHSETIGVFNASLFAVARAWFGARAAVAIAAAVLAAVIAAAVRRGRDPLRAGFLVLGTLLLVIPEVQPWYVLWLLPLVALWPEAPWLYFSVAVWLAYALPRHPQLIWLEYVPLFALLAWQARRPKGGSRPQCEDESSGPIPTHE